MKKGVIFIITLCMAGLLFSCASNKPAQSQPQHKEVGKRIGADGVAIPDWVTDRMSLRANDVKYFVGYATKFGADDQTVTMAEQNARTKLAQWKESVVSATTKSYSRTSGSAESNQTLQDLENVAITKAKANTSGIDFVGQWKDENSGFYVLLEYPKSDVLNDYKSTLNQFVRNKTAAAAEVKADAAYAILEEEMANAANDVE